jgi:isoleucyl-tRNA synthetase
VVVESDDEAIRAAVEAHADLLAERLNARTVVAVEGFDELVERGVPEMGEIGPAFGGDSQAVMAAVEGTTREALTDADGRLSVTVDGDTYELEPSMVAFEAEPPANVSGADFEGGSVYVDTSLTDEIEAEGYARDVVRRVQQMRKELDLEVDEPIRTALSVGDDRVAGFVDEHRELIAEETRTAEFVDATDAGEDALVEEWDVEGVAVTIAVEPVAERQAGTGTAAAEDD